MTAKRQLFVTTALPYANGPFHIGHMMEYIQADIWIRSQRMQGVTVHWVGADDTHGAPVMLKAEEEGITPEQLVTRIGAGRAEYLQGFHLELDHWYTTHSPENTQLAQQIYLELKKQGLIEIRPVEQFFDPMKQMFLPDRYVKGECPNCHAKDQYGDACEVCSKAYEPTELINPYSTLTGAVPVRRTSDHHFLKLSDPRCKEFLRGWVGGEYNGAPRLQAAVRNKVNEWLEGKGDQSLSDKDISRDAPYFGIPIPDAPGKYFYVWLDAPIGYLAALQNYFDTGKARANGETRSFEEFLASPEVEQIHFIGKDIIFFHTLLWPAMLRFAGRKTPDTVYVHGFLTASGDKMSKSRGTGIDPLRYLQTGMNPEWLRYYIAAKLNSNVEDLDFNPEDFIARVNSDLVGKYVNIASRIAPFLAKHFDNRMPPLAMSRVGDNTVDEEGWLTQALIRSNDIRIAFNNREFGKAIRLIMEIADMVNGNIAAYEPWVLSKSAATDEESRKKLARICAAAIAAFKALTLFLKPILPKLASDVEAYLRCPPLDWSVMTLPLEGDVERGGYKFLPTGHQFGTFKHLMTRVEPKQLDALFESAQPTAAAPAPAPAAKPQAEPAAAAAAAPGEITVDDFARMDIRIAKILAAEAVEGADKLVKVTVDVGDAQRTIFAGIKSAYTPEQLVGRLTLVLANLKPRKMRFGTSEGMVLAAGPGGKEIFLLTPDTGAAPGMKVK
jgi:methionyl-tRNA synthetase